MSAENRDNELIFCSPTDYLLYGKGQASGFSGVFINVANPCDVITQVISESGILPEGHVFGTGASLGSARLTDYLSQLTGLDHSSFDGLVMGEHGDSQMIPWCISILWDSLFLKKAARELVSYRPGTGKAYFGYSQKNL